MSRRPSSRPLPVAALTLLAGFGAFALAMARRARGIDFRGKVVLVTGGARGLGLVIARQLVAQGARVAICSRTPAELVRARQYLELWRDDVAAYACDVSDRAEVDRLVAAVVSRFGGLDVLVNNAGIIQVGPVAAMGEADFKQVMDTCFYGVLHCSLAAMPHLKRSPAARILNVTSIGGVVAVPHLLPYSCAKFAAVALSEGMFVEAARVGVRVTTAVPGLMRTGSSDQAIFKGDEEAERAWFSFSARLPGLSISAETAAARMIDACRHGDPVVTIGWPARLLRIAHHLLPSVALRGLKVADWMLPAPKPAVATPAPESEPRAA